MFRLVNMLSKGSATTTMPDDHIEISPQEEIIQNNVREQPMILSAVEATLSSYYKDEGDELLDMMDKHEIKVLFDDEMPAKPGEARYIEPENIIILSSQPYDILDMAKELHRVLCNIKS